MSGEKTKNVVHMTYDKDGYPTWHTELSPEENTTRATCIVPPDTVIPVVFVPGIMGSNLKFKNNERPKSLQNDIAWRPDSMKYTAWTFGNLSPAKRREILNPGITELDDSGEIPNSIIRFFKNVSPNVQTNWKSEFKRRGWGGIMLSSYGEILCNLEWNLNRIYDQDCEVSSYWQKDIVGVKATVDSDGKNQHPWGEMTGFEALDMTDLKEKVGDKYWFPVHAAGYNWLCSNEEAGNKLADKIKAYIKNYKDLGFDCEKAIIVTHSMGGLAARAVCHPEMGKIADIVAGVVHGEQPAIGAAAAYKRMHAGFEARWWNIVEILTARALGWSGREVTAVLSNAPGGLELLPTKRYPAGWLKINNGGNSEMQLPESDPYKEIYAERDQWWRLMNPEWIEPQVPAASAEGLEEIWNKYLKRLAVAERFHDSLADYYHPITHTHYGADEKHKAWTTFTWKKNRYAQQEEPPLGIPPPMGDNALGTIRIETASELAEYHMTPPDENGDGTVPEVSGADSASKAKFAAKMTGYDHQGSYSHKAVKDVTIYSIARIAKDI
ncbi:MAG: hypothetical protein KKH12_10370 [Gammaproteobacteria bacterium]|nr:hypothetical protein [Gammaproteobacteria bacterium]MBU1482065.1 hypothetical protein [Gammaproteobacteria bacterium]